MASPPFRCRVEWCKACPEGNSVDIDGTLDMVAVAERLEKGLAGG